MSDNRACSRKGCGLFLFLRAKEKIFCMNLQFFSFGC